MQTTFKYSIEFYDIRIYNKSGDNMNNNTLAFASNFKALRKKYGYTRAQIAEMFSFSAKTIEKWEYGSSIPSLETLCKVAEFFKVTLDSLVYEPNIKIKYLLAIDGGGTKTEFLLTDIYKKEIARTVLGASNAVDSGIENTKKILEQGIHKVCQGINLREVSLFAGLAGGITGNNKQEINKFLSKFGFACFGNGSDTESVLEIALEDKDGVAVIMGTGIIAFSQSGGRRHRIGGWGYLIDKGGSGFNIGSQAMDSALKYLDGRDGSKILCELIESKLSKPLPDSIAEIHNGGKAYIASFAPVVFDAFDRGDSFSAEIIDSNVKEVAEIITAGLKFLPKDKQNVVICGGLAKRSDILEKYFSKYLKEDIKVQFSKERVVNGALMLAEKIKNGGVNNA